jgi:hypothetical protein
MAACGAGEIMISAYCSSANATLGLDGMTGAHCDGDATAKAVVGCATK